MSLFSRVYEHLLPKARTFFFWASDTSLRAFFEGLAGLPEDARTFFDDRLDDAFPPTTSQLDLFEDQFGLSAAGLTDTERRDRLASAWLAVGGQSPRYLQDSVRASGFDIYIHQWWETPVSGAPVARDPNEFLADSDEAIVLWACEDASTSEALCGEDGSNLTPPFDHPVECGAAEDSPLGYALVNKIRTVDTVTLGCGDSELACSDRGVSEDPGGNFAYCAQVLSIDFGKIKYLIPSDPDRWRYFLYFGAQLFPNHARVSANRKDEFEDLLLKLCPGQQWLGILVDYT